MRRVQMTIPLSGLLLDQVATPTGALNTHNLWPLAQRASATGSEYLLNARYWDVATYLLMLASVPVFLWGFVVLAKEANH